MIHLFSFPTRIVFGNGAHEYAIKEAPPGARKALLVTDPGLVYLDIFNLLRARLEAAKLDYEVFSGISPNPTTADVAAGVAAYRAAGCDWIVAMGGGSAIDGAKGIRLMATHPGQILDYDDLKNGSDRITADMPVMIAIPTTAGTGSEVGRSTVVTDPETNRKVVIFSPHLLPTAAIVDPDLMVGLPARLTAATGMDALAHCVEAYCATGYHPICDSIALGGARLVVGALERAVWNGQDLEARTDMAMAATMGAVAFQKGLGLCHSLAHPLSTVAGVHHGLANGIMLWRVLEFNREALADRMTDLSRALGVPDAVAAVRDLAGQIGIPEALAEVGVTADMLPELCAQAWEDACHKLNPRRVTPEDIRDLYEQALLSASLA
ncbi:MAG: iron-containing alcohol dehydrogenase [Candidatus Sericytochromatia bacterium]|nr:iron-containing alcohol dehydrogenase [Candidatus Tanganyikabacteria bacterium]